MTGRYDDAAVSMVLNALVEIGAEQPVTLVDEDSVATVSRAYKATTTPDERHRFVAALNAKQTDSNEDTIVASNENGHESTNTSSASDTVLVATAREVTAELAARNARFTVTHEAPLSLTPRSVALYRYGQTRDPDIVTDLPISESVRSQVVAALAEIEADAPNEAAQKLVMSINDASTHDDAITVRVLGAWARHWAGNDTGAIDLVEEALHLDTKAWAAQQVGLAANHQSPEFFRDGRLAATVYLRARVAMSDNTSIEAALGYATSHGELEWRTLTGPFTCAAVDLLPSEGRLRFRLSGDPHEMPTLHMYYLTLGVIEPLSQRARSVDEILIDGPITTDAKETLHIETVADDT